MKIVQRSAIHGNINALMSILGHTESLKIDDYAIFSDFTSM